MTPEETKQLVLTKIRDGVKAYVGEKPVTAETLSKIQEQVKNLLHDLAKEVGELPMYEFTVAEDPSNPYAVLITLQSGHPLLVKLFNDIAEGRAYIADMKTVYEPDAPIKVEEVPVTFKDWVGSAVPQQASLGHAMRVRPSWAEKLFVETLNDLLYEVKISETTSPMIRDFVETMKAFCAKWKLDQDPHAFATLPEEPK